MSKLTDTNSRRRNKSKDFAGSPLSNMFNTAESKSESTKNTPSTTAKENETSKPKEETVTEVKKEPVQSKVEVENSVETAPPTQDLISKLPKKHKNSGLDIIKKKDKDDFSLIKTVDGKYKLARNTMYKKVKSIPKTLSMREDLNMILDDIVKKDDTGSYVRGLKSTIVANGIMRELYEIGAISKEDLKRELRPYE